MSCQPTGRPDSTDVPHLRYACDQLAEMFNITLMSESDPAQFLSVAGPEAKGLRSATADHDATLQFYTEQR